VTARLHPDDIRAMAAELLRLAAKPPDPIADPDRDRAAERLVFALHVYSGYRIDSRGPLGCILDALEAIAPEVAAEVRAGSACAVHDRRWPDFDSVDR